jgi:hypothetical protein
VNDLWFETMGYKTIMKRIILKMGLFPFLFLHDHGAYQFVIFDLADSILRNRPFCSKSSDDNNLRHW